MPFPAPFEFLLAMETLALLHFWFELQQRVGFHEGRIVEVLVARARFLLDGFQVFIFLFHRLLYWDSPLDLPRGSPERKGLC